MSRILPVDRAIYTDESVRLDLIWEVVNRCRPFICSVATRGIKTATEGSFIEREVEVDGVALHQVAGPPYEAYQRPQCPHFKGEPLKKEGLGHCGNFVPRDGSSVLHCEYSKYSRSEEES
jgi:hypothetical protein